MLPNKANPTPIISNTPESCSKASCFPGGVLPSPYIPTNLNHLNHIGMNPFLPNLLPSIAFSYQLSLLAAKPFQGLPNPLMPNPAFPPPSTTAALPPLNARLGLNPSAAESQRILDSVQMMPLIESSIKRELMMNNPFLTKLGSEITGRRPNPVSHNSHIFNSYPDLWLDFQRKCQLMMEEMRRKEQSSNEVQPESSSTSRAHYPQLDDRENRIAPLEMSNSKVVPPFPSEILKLHSMSSNQNTSFQPTSPHSECSTISPNNKALSLSAYIDPPRALQQALLATSKESSLNSPMIGHKLYSNRDRVENSVCVTSGEATQPSRFRCQTCKRSYSTATGLHKHREQHCQGEQSQRQFSCQHCSKVYHSMSALKMHIRTHTLPCKCTLCGKAFSRMWLLNGHIRTHTGEKPFSCHICARAFADRSNLRAHMQTHSEVKRYRCSCCEKTFSRMGLLTKHKASGCSGRFSNGESSFHSEASDIHDSSLNY